MSDSTVSVVYPNNVGSSYYSGYTAPTGSVQVPSTVTHSGSTYMVVSIGNNAFSGCTGMTSLSIPNSVTSIGNSACSQCVGLTSVDIPVSVTMIGDNAFMGCSHLLSVVLPNMVTMVGVGTFQGCSSLSSVVLGSSVTTIGNVAFEGCASLTSLYIPDAVTMLGNWAFCNCTSLDSIYIGASVSYIWQNTFSGCNSVGYIHYNARNASCSYYSAGGYHSSLPVAALTHLIVGDSVRTLPQYAFADAPLLNTVSLGVNVNSIDANAFSGTTNVHYLHYNTNRFSDATFPRAAFSSFAALSHLVVGSNVLHIPSNAFAGKVALETLSVASPLATIGDSAFYGCLALQGPLTLPSTLTSIGASAFQGCTNLDGVLQLPASLQSIGASAFAACSKITGTLTIPSGMLTMGTGAFADCDSILSVNIASNALAIPNGAFDGCDRLFLVSLGTAAPTIGNAAFRNCVRLSEVSLGGALTSIGQNAFKGCIRLNNPTLPGTLSTIGDSAFYGCSAMGGHLVFPAAVTAIGDYAYANISPITLIEMRGANPPAIYANTFASATSNTPLMVPCGAMLNYVVADYWDDFSNIGQSAPFYISLTANDTVMGSAIVLQQPTCSNYQAIIQAVADSGFHFLRWLDGSTVNPRQVLLSSDTAFTAIFVSDNSYIAVSSNNVSWGTVSGAGTYGYNDTAYLTAVPADAYHFQRWSDGNTQNPRPVVVTQDSLFVAIFYSNTSLLSLSSNDSSMGTVTGAGTYTYQDLVTIAAIPYYGYHFTTWNDGLTINPRTIAISQDTSFVATFAPNSYAITLASSSPAMGTVTGGGSYRYLDTAMLSASASYGYSFAQWSDGNTANPRWLVVSSDTMLVAQFQPLSYVVTAMANDTALGTVTGGGSYNYSTTATLSAIPNEGSHFVQWNDGDTTNPRTVVVTGNASYTAQFVTNVYSIMVSSANPLLGSVAGAGSYSHNATVTLTATPAVGCYFVQWNDGNTDNPRIIVATQNASYIAQFAVSTFSITVNSNNSSLGTTSGSGTYSYNTQATLLATPNYGYHFVQWNDTNTDNPRVVTVTQNASYTAIFDTNQYYVTASSNNPASGSVSGGGLYKYLSSAVLTASPMPHHHFVQWSDSLTNNPRTITVLSDTTLVADFQVDSHTLSVVSANPTMGHTSGSGVVAYGNVVFISATANYGYRFTQWNDGVTQNPRRVVVSTDTSFTAQFLPNTYTAIVTSNDTTLGVVSGGGTYNYLTPLTLTATPFGSSRFVGWSDGNSDNPRTLLLTHDTVIQALFVVNTCQLDCHADNSSMGIVSGSGTYNYMAQVPILATAYANYHFVQWSDGVTSNPRIVTLTSDTVLIAYFQQEPTYTITAVSNNIQQGTVTGSGQYHYGQEAHLTALPKEHCRFVHWSDGNTANPRTVHVIADATYQAVFAPESFTITVSSNNNSLGAAYGGGSYFYGEEAILTAVAFPSAHFTSWSDGSIENPRTIVVTRNITLQALFDSELGIDEEDLSEPTFVVTSKGHNIYIIGVPDRAVSIFDLYGRQISVMAPALAERAVAVPSAGVYLVCPEGCTPKKVVVL
ncbi:MAG: leucine-rich repeat domain-containing protein [Bacteroidales bacterium]|nr:leucine-rich repeat domain-containing protein [Bacteroidales bacterium]